jgi:hypothetical protein
MTTSKPKPQGSNQPENFPLFLVRLTRKEKAPEIFKLKNLSNIIVKVNAYRAQEGLTGCYDCQNFVHVWKNCRQHSRCL